MILNESRLALSDATLRRSWTRRWPDCVARRLPQDPAQRRPALPRCQGSTALQG